MVSQFLEVRNFLNRFLQLFFQLLRVVFADRKILTCTPHVATDLFCCSCRVLKVSAHRFLYLLARIQQPQHDKQPIIAVTKSAYATFHAPPWCPPWSPFFLMTIIGRFSWDCAIGSSRVRYAAACAGAASPPLFLCSLLLLEESAARVRESRARPSSSASIFSVSRYFFFV